MVLPGMTKQAEQDHERAFANDREAHVLLDLIDAEFRSDPMSVQCFDLRIVERVRVCVESRKVFKENYGI